MSHEKNSAFAHMEAVNVNARPLGQLHKIAISPGVGPAWPKPARLTLIVLLLTFSLSLPIICAQQKPDAPAVMETLPSGPMQAKATESCLECHEVRIILQQRLSKAAWTKEVDKMVKWGALVDAVDRDSLIDYLSTNFSPDKPQYEAPSTSSERRAVKRSKRDPAQ